MKTVSIVMMIFMSVFAFANDKDTDLLDKMKEQVVKQETEKKESQLSTANVPVEVEKHEEKRITFSIQLRQCMDQGHTKDECDTLTKNNPQTDKYYDVKNPRVPSLSEAKDDVFINIQIKQ